MYRFFGRVEIFARGAEEARRAAEAALVRGDHLAARAHAKALLLRVPRSPMGLALLAEAAEGCWHDEEALGALSQLVEVAPWRQEVWLQLGIVGLRCGAPEARDALERAATNRASPAVTRAALLALADRDIMLEQWSRAARWLARVPSHESQPDPQLAILQAECASGLGQIDQAQSHLLRSVGLPEGETALRARLLLLNARLAREGGAHSQGGDAISLALGALLLDAPGAERLLAELVSETRDGALVAKARLVLGGLGMLDGARFRAAFAMAEGRHDDARSALMLAAEGGDVAAAESLLALSVTQRDHETLQLIHKKAWLPLPAELRTILEACDRLERGEPIAAASLVSSQSGHGDGGWGRALMTRVGRALVPVDPNESACWPELLAELGRGAMELGRADLMLSVEALAVERERPLRVAVLGEFNAGKSTFINALLGADVAPTGVRPTTATLHWVAWAPDSFARVVVKNGVDRVVPHEGLKRALEEVVQAGGQTEKVQIYAPIERLKRIEVLDTPGFNASVGDHAGQARRAIEEAHVALWIVDATAPLKETERQVLAELIQARVPVQILMNKCDRLTGAEREQVMIFLCQSLEGAGLASLAAPVALSARLALAGRLGDVAALQESGWQEVEDVLADAIVCRCDVLREQALRRKGARLAGSLASMAARRHAQRSEDARHVAAVAVERQRAGERLRAETEPLVQGLLRGLEASVCALEDDLRPLREMSEEARRSDEVRQYLIDTTAGRLAGVVAQDLVDALRLTDDAGAAATELLLPVVRAVIAGAAAVLGPQQELRSEVLRAALLAAVSEVAALLSQYGSGRDEQQVQPWLQLRLEAIAEALGTRS